MCAHQAALAGPVVVIDFVIVHDNCFGLLQVHGGFGEQGSARPVFLPGEGRLLLAPQTVCSTPRQCDARASCHLSATPKAFQCLMRQHNKYYNPRKGQGGCLDMSLAFGAAHKLKHRALITGLRPGNQSLQDTQTQAKLVAAAAKPSFEYAGAQTCTCTQQLQTQRMSLLKQGLGSHCNPFFSTAGLLLSVLS